MSGRKPKTLLFENPANVTATLSVNVTWFPATFGAVELGSFPLNLWLLRADAPTNEEIEVYAPFLLARMIILLSTLATHSQILTSHRGTGCLQQFGAMDADRGGYRRGCPTRWGSPIELGETRGQHCG